MPESDRIVFGRGFKPTPLWMWWLQRLSGIALGPLVALHVMSPSVARHPALLTLLLAIVAMHGHTGLMRMAPALRHAARAAVAAWAWTAIVLVAGALVVAAG